MRWVIAVTLGAAATLFGLAARAAFRERTPVAGFPMTTEDKLWLGRALVGETGGENRRAAAAVAWSMRNRYEQKRRWTSFTQLLRAYCQPINPIWESPTASGCVRSPEKCTATHLARRASIRALTWNSLPAVTQQVVADLAAGRLENPIGDRNTFAAYTFSGANMQVGGNWFGRD